MMNATMTAKAAAMTDDALVSAVVCLPGVYTMDALMDAIEAGYDLEVCRRSEVGVELAKRVQGYGHPVKFFW